MFSPVEALKQIRLQLCLMLPVVKKLHTSRLRGWMDGAEADIHSVDGSERMRRHRRSQ